VTGQPQDVSGAIRSSWRPEHPRGGAGILASTGSFTRKSASGNAGQTSWLFLSKSPNVGSSTAYLLNRNDYSLLEITGPVVALLFRGCILYCGAAELAMAGGRERRPPFLRGPRPRVHSRLTLFRELK